jgi:hypothetical protein
MVSVRDGQRAGWSACGMVSVRDGTRCDPNPMLSYAARTGGDRSAARPLKCSSPFWFHNSGMVVGTGARSGR